MKNARGTEIGKSAVQKQSERKAKKTATMKAADQKAAKTSKTVKATVKAAKAEIKAVKAKAAKAEKVTPLTPAEIASALTPAEIALCREAVHRTYGIIAYDAGLKESAKPAQILEVVLDSDYIKMYGKLPFELSEKFEELVKEIACNSKTFSAAMKQLVPIFWNAPKAAAVVSEDILETPVAAPATESDTVRLARAIFGEKVATEVAEDILESPAEQAAIAAEIAAAEDGTGAAKAEALRAEAEANTPAPKKAKKQKQAKKPAQAANVWVVGAPDFPNLPLSGAGQPGAAQPGDRVKPCPVCEAKLIAVRFRICGQCLDERTAAKKAASVSPEAAQPSA